MCTPNIPFTQWLNSCRYFGLDGQDEGDATIFYLPFSQWLGRRCYVDLDGQVKHAPSCLCKKDLDSGEK